MTPMKINFACTNCLEIFDVDKIPEHGGSLRIYARHMNGPIFPRAGKIVALLLDEVSKGMLSLDYYTSFRKKVQGIKDDFMEFLYDSRYRGETMIAYGGAAKGNTFLNFCGVKPDLIPYVIDKSPYKQGKYLPGSHIPVWDEGVIKVEKSDWIIILPWNLKDEIAKQLEYTKEWGCQLIVAVPEIKYVGGNDGRKDKG